MSCGRKIGPFNCCSVVCGDCLELMRQLPDGCVDAVVTDPPYGIGFSYDAYEDSYSAWVSLMDSAIPQIRRVSTFAVLPSSRIDRLGWWYTHHEPDWLISWYKGSPGHQSPIGFNDWESHIVYGCPSNRAMHDHFQTECGFEDNGHPCPKPLEWGLWLVARAAKHHQTILDPFAGSGTTLVAAKKLGRHFLGFEISEQYCQIARDRLARIDAQPSLFEAKPEQLSLEEHA